MEEAIREIYQRMSGEGFESFLCEDCRSECCNFEFSGHIPFLTAPEWNLILEKVRDCLPPSQVVFCPFLDQGKNRCTIYEVRPFRCRLFFCERYPGASSLFNPYISRYNTFLEEYRHITSGLDQRSIVDFLDNY